MWPTSEIGELQHHCIREKTKSSKINPQDITSTEKQCVCLKVLITCEIEKLGTLGRQKCGPGHLIYGNMASDSESAGKEGKTLKDVVSKHT